MCSLFPFQKETVLDFDRVSVLFTGPVELAAAGVSIALFNQASRITIFPLVSITTSFVAEEDTVADMKQKAAQVDHFEDEKLDGLEKGAAKEGVETEPKADEKLENANDATSSKDSEPKSGTPSSFYPLINRYRVFIQKVSQEFIFIFLTIS